MIRASAVLAVLGFLAHAGAEQPFHSVGEPAGQGKWLVSPRSYWRHHYTFRPAQSVDKDLNFTFQPTRYAAKNTVPAANALSTPAPPADWTNLEFDDSGWCVGRAPLPWLPEMDQDGEGPYACHFIRVAAGRTRFFVPDPSAVQRLTLTVGYYGGIVVSVNGRQIARGHAPEAGPLAEELFAEPYPELAYRPTDPDHLSRARQAGLLGHYDFWSVGRIWHAWRVEPAGQDLLELIRRTRVRQLEIDVPRDALRAGVNVLAVENRLSPMRVFGDGRRPHVAPTCGKTPHIGVHEISMAAQPAGSVVSADLRPDGVQAWAEDIHRWLLEEDFLEPGVPQRRTLRLAVARNGVASAQAVIGTSRALANPSAAASNLVGPGGARIAAPDVRVRWGRSLPVSLVRKVEMATRHNSFRVYMQDRGLIRYRGAPQNTWVIQWGGTGADQKQLSGMWRDDNMRIFDHLTDAAPGEIRAGTSQPVWLTVRVPPQAAPGLYRGTLTIKADGLEPVEFPVRLHVFDFELPPPWQFVAYSGIDQSPWSLAKWHNVRPWSDEHWRLVEQSVRQAGELAARVIGIPVIHKTELDNDDDAMIRWVAKGQDCYGYDFTLADRYLDLWRKHGHEKPDVIVYLVHPADNNGRGGGTGTVSLLDPASGKLEAFTPPTAETPHGLAHWIDCAKAIRQHLNQRGVADEHIHWGLFYDYIGEKSYALAGPLSKEVPTVGWARSSHEGRKIHGGEALAGKGEDFKVTWNAAVRAEQKPPFTLDRKTGQASVTSHKGWSDPKARLLLPRADSDVNALSVYPPLWQLREVQEMPVTSMYRGFARICVDGWGRGSYFGPFNSYLTYPSPQGGRQEGSAQFEALREGLQETEARIFLEKQSSLPAQAQQVLDLRTQRVWMVPPRPEGQRIAEYHTGWRDMNWDLYSAAATAAGGQAPSAEQRNAFFAPD